MQSLVYAGPEGDFHLLVTFDFCDDAICAGDALGSDLRYDAGDYIRIRVRNDSTASAPKLLQFAFESGWDALIDGDLSVADTGLDAGTFNFVRDTSGTPEANTMPDQPFTTFQRFQADPTSDDGALNQFEALTIVGLIQAGQLAASSPMDALVDQIEEKVGFLRIGGLGGACLESDGCNFLLGPPTEVPTTTTAAPTTTTATPTTTTAAPTTTTATPTTTTAAPTTSTLPETGVGDALRVSMPVGLGLLLAGLVALGGAALIGDRRRSR